MDYNLIKSGDILFEKGKNPNEYAYFGWQKGFGVEFLYSGYVDGYKQGADQLIDYSLEMLKQGRIDIPDKFVFPICFMYRQFFELALKKIYICYSYDEDKKKENEIKRVSHNLMKLWDIVHPIIEEYLNNEDTKYIMIAKDYVMQMHQYSISSFEFRYPTEKNGNFIHEKWEFVDLVNLKDKMNRFYNFYSQLSQIIDEKINEQ